MHHSKISRKKEHGNVLWFILVAIILITALTMILTRSGSTVDQSGDVEQMRILTSQVMRYASGIEASIQQMKTRDVSENDISFQNGTTATNYTNANCTDAGCLVFGAGGGANYTPPPAGANDGSDWIFTGANNVGTSAGPIGLSGARVGNDLIMLLPNATPAFCAQINRDLDIGSPGVMPVDTTGIALTPFVGAFDAALVELDGDPTPYELDRKSAGCFTDAAASVTYFYYVLLAR